LESTLIEESGAAIHTCGNAEACGMVAILQQKIVRDFVGEISSKQYLLRRNVVRAEGVEPSQAF